MSLSPPFTIPPLKRDGVIDTLYHYLYLRSIKTGSGLKIRIPDTIVYRFRLPAYWFHTADDQLELRDKELLKNKHIEQAFGGQASGGSDIVATYICDYLDHDGQQMTAVEYFDKKGLHDFLFRRKKVNDGILQKFIEPRGTKNEVLRVTWTPHACVMERRVNRHDLTDPVVDRYDRAVTFDGEHHLSELNSVHGDLFPRHLRGICAAVVRHLRDCSPLRYEIVRMVLYFKVDIASRINFLYCSSLRLRGEENVPLPLSESVNVQTLFKRLAGARKNDSISRRKFMLLRGKCYLCPVCQFVREGDAVPLDYRSIVVHHRRAREEHARELAARGGTGPGGLSPPPTGDEVTDLLARRRRRWEEQRRRARTADAAPSLGFTPPTRAPPHRAAPARVTRCADLGVCAVAAGAFARPLPSRRFPSSVNRRRSLEILMEETLLRASQPPRGARGRAGARSAPGPDLRPPPPAPPRGA
eukprot:tig00001128_g7180.t1